LTNCPSLAISENQKMQKSLSSEPMSTQQMHQQQYRHYLSYRELMILRDTKCLYCGSSNQSDYTLDEYLHPNHNDGEMIVHDTKKINQQVEFIHDTLQREGFELTDQEIKFKLLQYTEALEKREIEPRELFIKSDGLYHSAYKYLANGQNDEVMVVFNQMNKMGLAAILFGVPLFLKNLAFRRVVNVVMSRMYRPFSK